MRCDTNQIIREVVARESVRLSANKELSYEGDYIEAVIAEEIIAEEKVAKKRGRPRKSTRESCDANYIRLKAEDIRSALLKLHPFGPWCVLDEVPLLRLGEHNIFGGRPRIDLLAIRRANDWSSDSLIREGYEIKVDRRDFLDELKNPEKRRRALGICDYFSFAVPEGLAEPNEVPRNCGLFWIYDRLTRPEMKKAPSKLRSKPATPAFMLDLAYRAYQVGRRHGAETCTIKDFSEISWLAQVAAEKDSSVHARIHMIRKLADRLWNIQRPAEARELSRIAREGEAAALKDEDANLSATP